MVRHFYACFYCRKQLLIGCLLGEGAPFEKKGGALMIILLLLVFPANIYLVFSEEAQIVFQGTRADAIIRLPFQIPLIFIAYWHSKERVSKWVELFCILSFPPTIIYFLTL